MKKNILILFLICASTHNSISAMLPNKENKSCEFIKTENFTPTTSPHERSGSPLHKAASEGDLFKIEQIKREEEEEETEFIQQKVDVDKKDHEGNTALHRIVLASNEDLHVLLDRDYCYRILFPEDFPRKKAKIIRAILAMGARKDITNDNGQTPFDCLEGCPEDKDHNELRDLLNPSK